MAVVNLNNTITRDMITLLALSKAPYNDVMKLFDGVTTDGDSYTFQPDTSSSSFYYPHPILIDFRTTYDLSYLRFRDDSGSPTFNVKTGNSLSSMTDHGNITLDQFGVWRTFTLTVSAKRFLLITLNSNRSNQEIEIYGERVGSVYVPPSPTVNLPNLENGLGVNAYMSTPANILAPFKHIRNFAEMRWFYDASKLYRASSAYSGGVDASRQLAAFIANDTETILCLQDSPTYLLNKDASTHDNDYKPILYSDSPDNVASYQEIAERYFDFSANLGSNSSLSTGLISWQTTPRYTGDTIDTPATGINKLTRIETWNEPDKTWKDVWGHFSSFRNAIRESMSYDGHVGAYTRAGVKTADSNMKYVMAGITSINLDYIKGMDYWYQTYRSDGKFAADYLQFHFYANSAGGQFGGDSVGICPEAGLVYEQLAAIVAWKNVYRPTLKIILGENGYELNQSNQRIPDIAGFTREQTHANWYLRSMLEAIGAGADEYYWFDFSDNPSVNGTETYLYTFCGLVTKEPNYVPKHGYNYAVQFSALVKNKQYKLRANASVSGVRIYKYQDIANDKELWFIWSPTGNNTVLTNYSITDDTSFNTVKKGVFSYTSTTPTVTTLTKSSSYSNDVSEKPFYLEFSNVSRVVTATIINISNNESFYTTATITVNVTATTTVGTIVNVKFYIDNVLQNTDTGSPFTYTIPANTLSVGTYALKVVSDDGVATAQQIINIVIVSPPTNIFLGKKKMWW